MTSVFLSASLPTVVHADVALPPPPPKKSSVDLPPPPPKSGGSGGVDLPPPPPKKKGAGETSSKGSSDGGGGSGGSSGGSGRSSERTTGLVLLITGGAITVTGTVMVLLGAGLKPKGNTGGKNTGLLVAGGVTSGVGLVVAAVGLVMILNSNNGRLPPLRSLELDHPAVRTPTWASAPMPGFSNDAPGFVLPLGGTF